jgi:phenylalanyl-tRNA synthetase alpha chain
MAYSIPEVAKAADLLKKQFDTLTDKRLILRAPELKELFLKIKDVPAEERKSFGAEINLLKTEVESWLAEEVNNTDYRRSIDVTAPFSANSDINNRPNILTASGGSIHPLTKEISKILDIFYRMGFTALESRQIDDDFHMFESVNFPIGHPARDDWDTFMTTDGFIAPAHTSTMQNRALKLYRDNLLNNEPIAVVIPGRCFRNEDLDVTHEHTFFQLEGIYVDKGVNVGNLIATLKTYMSEFFEQELNVKIQPFYFPFTEPSFEFAVERPLSMRKDKSEAENWLEIGGCGMIHPNVLSMADIDANIYTGFAFGFGIERMVMLKSGIEDIRHFESGKLDFLRQFK